MNRLCIYVTYNKENIIYPYIGAVLKALKSCCDKVYLVCNYEMPKAGLAYAQDSVDGIFYRQNKGYDSGAFKDALCDFLGWKEIEHCEELVLANDSFFGFFYPIQDTFERMDQENCDFWGMTGQAAGVFAEHAYSFDAHVHSFFLVLRQKVIRSAVFQHFWETLQYPKTFSQAIITFEIELNACLKQHDFSGKSLIDVWHITLAENEIPFNTMPCRLIRDYKIPVLKKKCLLIRNPGFAEALEAIAYLRHENSYPTEWITEYLDKQFFISKTEYRNSESLEIFCRNHAQIYIYGAGVCGRNLSVYFEYKGWKYKGMICTDNKEGTEGILTLEEAEFTPETGIVISVLNSAVASEIAEHIGNRCTREQLFFISDCNAIKLPDDQIQV